MMKIKILLVVLILLTTVNSQKEEPVDAPTQNDALDQLITTLNNVDTTTKENTKKMEDLYGFVEDNYRKQGGILIVGMTVTMMIFYLAIIFFDRLRRMKKKKSHQEYITELEEKLVIREDGIVKNIQKLNKEVNSVALSVTGVKHNLENVYGNLKELNPEKLDIPTTKKRFMAYGITLGFVLANVVNNIDKIM